MPIARSCCVPEFPHFTTAQTNIVSPTMILCMHCFPNRDNVPPLVSLPFLHSGRHYSGEMSNPPTVVTSLIQAVSTFMSRYFTHGSSSGDMHFILPNARHTMIGHSAIG